MVVDTSAIYAVLFAEPEKDRIVTQLRNADTIVIPATVVAELGI